MNFGVVAIEMLEAMYRQEMDVAGRPGYPAEPSVRSVQQIPDAIVEHNLAGIDVDPVALELAAETVAMKLGARVSPAQVRLHRADALFDQVVQSESFDVVVTNPPYLSSRNLPGQTVKRLKQHYPRAWRDTYACFIQRCLELARPGGRVGMLTMQSFMFTGGFEKLRRHLYDTAAIEWITHFGPGLFDIGNPGTLQTVAMVLRREPEESARQDQTVQAERLVEAIDKQHDRPQQYSISQRNLRTSPRGAWIYWLTDRHRAVFRQFSKLAEIAPPRQGLATTDNRRFVRHWWEVEPTTLDAPRRASEKMWRAYVKSGRFRRWYESPRYRVNWRDDGCEIKQAILDRYPYLDGKWQWVAKNTAFYGRSGVTYSYLTSGRFSARRLEAGAIFDVAGSSLFPEDPLTLLAVLNSSVAAHLLAAINPTVNFQVGDLAQLPVPRCGTDELRELVAEAIAIQRRLDTFDETAADFIAPMDWGRADELHQSLHDELGRIEQAIERLVQSLYGLDEPANNSERSPPLDRRDLARRWVGFAAARVLGRWGAARQLDVIPIRPATRSALAAVRAELSSLTGASAARDIESAVQGTDRFLATQFFDWHLKRYHGRPVLWMLGTDARAALVLHDHATPERVDPLIHPARPAAMSPRWDRFIDDGILVNLSPLWEFVPHRPLQSALRKVNEDRLAGRLCWSSTASFTKASTLGFGGPVPRRRRRQEGAAPYT
jgi:hypothetical protein